MAKFKVEDIKTEADSLGWTLLSETYKNLDTEIEFQCPNGHHVITTYAIWRADHKCPICDKPAIQQTDRVIKKKKDCIRVLALDQATKTTGWAIFDGNTVIKFGTITFDKGEADERINQIENWLLSMLAIWRPDRVVLEDIQLQPQKSQRNWEHDDGNSIMNVLTYKSLAWLQGVLINCLFKNEIKYELVPPAVWREDSHITGKYRADKKKSAQLKVKEWFDLNVSNDEADAICIGKYAAAAVKRKTEMLNWN